MADLDRRARLLLFHGAAVPVDTVLSLGLELIGPTRLRELGVTAANLRAAALAPCQLRSLGVTRAEQLRALGFDALDLREASFASEAIAVYGAAETAAAFLRAPADAVCLVGSAGGALLNVRAAQLLGCCAGDAVAAESVLRELPPGALDPADVPLDTLLSTGLQLKQLERCGYPLAALVSLFAPSSEQLRLLGARVRL